MNVSQPQLHNQSCLRTLRQITSIAGTTVIESVQQPVALLLLMLAVGTTLLVPVFQFHRFSEDGRLARDSGLSCMLVFGLALAVGTAGRSVAGEITRGTAAAALGKPVARTTFLLAKWLGVLLVVALFWCALLSATMVSERCSAHFLVREDTAGYVTDPVTLLLALSGMVLALLIAAVRHHSRGVRFGVSAFYGVLISQVAVVLLSGFYNRFGQLYLMQHQAVYTSDAHMHTSGGMLFYHIDLNLRVIPVAILLLFALAVFAALATALATRMQTGAVLAICATLLFLGLAGGTLKGHAPLLSVRGLLPGILPDIQHFWLCDAIARGGRLSWHYVVKAGVYAFTCCVLFLTAGCAVFRGRDLG